MRPHAGSQTLGATSCKAEPVRDADAVVEVDLDVDQRVVLVRGLVEWGGSAAATGVLAVAMGSASLDDLAVKRRRLRAPLEAGQALSRWD